MDVPITDWYVRLSVLAKDYSVRFGLIGGITDTLPHNEVEDKFYGLYVACQSFTNLLLSDNDQTERPVFLIRPHREYIKYHFEQDTPTEKLVEMLDRINARMDAWKKNPQWFWPDGCHPNRLGHEKLYQFLKSCNLFG